MFIIIIKNKFYGLQSTKAIFGYAVSCFRAAVGFRFFRRPEKVMHNNIIVSNINLTEKRQVKRPLKENGNTMSKQ